MASGGQRVGCLCSGYRSGSYSREETHILKMESDGKEVIEGSAGGTEPFKLVYGGEAPENDDT